MIFNSHEFLAFFVAVTAGYFLMAHRFRWVLLLGASCLFYMAFVPAYLLVLFAIILVDYGLALAISGTSGRRRKAFLGAAIAATVLNLGFFKYCNFFNANVAALADLIGWNYPIGFLEIVLPLGLSFHTFQSLAYVIEVYRGRQKAERHFGIYALYVMFYPQLVAGPIERPQNLLHQFRERHEFDWDQLLSGLRLMLWGFFKKTVIADRLAGGVNRVYENPADFTGLALIAATLLFSLQMYCDFSGYSDIARGAARTMGFRLMRNFDRPFHSRSFAEYWKRWHISLSTWFRDYLYVPLGGDRRGKARWRLNVMLVFAVSGLWHGASWSFVVWGALNGGYLIVEAWSREWRDRLAARTGLIRLPRLRTALQILSVFLLVGYSHIFFRAESMEDALYVSTHVFDLAGWTPAMSVSWNNMLGLGIRFTDLCILAPSLLLLESVHCVQYFESPGKLLAARPAWVRWAAYQGFTAWILLFAVYRTSEFIYFQF